MFCYRKTTICIIKTSLLSHLTNNFVKYITISKTTAV